MIYPIVAYGHPILKKKAVDIEKGTDVKELVEDMFETMYSASGVGLAGPQIGKGLRIFVVDGEPMEDETTDGFKKAFINPEIIDEDGDDWAFEEGCLSIPGIREDVYRPETVTIKYFDEDWNEHTETYEGVAARIIQHEYDHIEGVLFTDYLSGLKKRLLKGKLNNISKGKVKVGYRMKFPSLK
ncbi:peptide deformylase [Mangrovivirga sp. M17]|uniref:Peptide deformylase n=1 Tax=Mangrovivirga halotolerans TaxID=2993936 RepID=A0ABT3RT87_9BACT|nr:peptide deformylase [Mangrovivirga halotolerans]MCX2744568.1 peptide deformylase [Mangrovivirga halotolerans]